MGAGPPAAMFGYPRTGLMLRREGLVINHRRTERVYREEGVMDAKIFSFDGYQME